MKHLDMKIACGKQPQPTFALLLLKKKVSDNDKCGINTYKANHFNTSWMEYHHHILYSLPRPQTHLAWCPKSHSSHSLH